jgi:hypothetical protein
MHLINLFYFKYLSPFSINITSIGIYLEFEGGEGMISRYYSQTNTSLIIDKDKITHYIVMKIFSAIHKLKRREHE